MQREDKDMEKKFYTAAEISEITGYSRCKAYDIIKKLNIEIKKLYQDKKEQPIIFSGRINKEYFDKRMQI